MTGLSPTQSTTWQNMYSTRGSSNAVDGNTTGSCAHTAGQLDPWWRVQLPGPHMITKVVLYNRSDCCSERLSPVYVYVQESGIGTLCGSHTTSSVGLALLNFTCPAPIPGDMLWVEVRGQVKWVTICELKAYGWKY